MREIKFRAWDKKDKMMVCPPIPDLVLFLDGTLAIGEECQATTEFELMQYTGLKDKNGKEIYEGDVLKGLRLMPWTVEWNEDICGFYPFADYDADCDGYPKKEDSVQFVVIGNIYENPELLTGLTA